MQVRREIVIGASPTRVWRCLTEPAMLPQWISGFVDETVETPGPPAVGTVSTMRLKEGAKIATYRSVLTAWRPGERLAIRLTGGSFSEGMAMDVDYAIAAEGGGTRLAYDARVPMKGIFLLLAPIMRLAAGANAKRDLARLKTLAESAEG